MGHWGWCGAVWCSVVVWCDTVWCDAVGSGVCVGEVRVGWEVREGWDVVCGAAASTSFLLASANDAATLVHHRVIYCFFSFLFDLLLLCFIGAA